MFRRVRPHLTYANVMVTLMAFVVFGGASAYASHELILSSDIKDGEVKEPDLGGGAVTRAKLRDGAVQRGKIDANAVISIKVADNSLTGEDILESSLGKVPDADTLDGLDSTGFVQGKGKAYRAQKDAATDVTETVLFIPGFGHINVGNAEAGCVLSWFNDSGANLRVVWFSKNGVGVEEAQDAFAANLTTTTHEPEVVLLQAGREDRTVTVTVTATELVATDACRSSAQALAQID
jgi:hypothetical protein